MPTKKTKAADIDSKMPNEKSDAKAPETCYSVTLSARASSRFPGFRFQAAYIKGLEEDFFVRPSHLQAVVLSRIPQGMKGDNRIRIEKVSREDADRIVEVPKAIP